MDSEKTILYSACLMLEIAKVDNIITKDELNIIEEILSDFYKISNQKALDIINASYKELEESIDIFQYATFLNINLSYKDRLDLIKCIFEVGYADGKLHYLEYHYIKTISNLLKIEKEDIIKAKLEIKNYF